MRRWFFVGVIIGAVVAVLSGQVQAPPATPPPDAPPPVLSELDRLRVVNALQAVELWSYKMQAAAVELQAARAAADKVLTSVAVPGWQLTDKLEYVKAPKDK